MRSKISKLTERYNSDTNLISIITTIKQAEILKTDKQTNERTDICECRVAFMTENR